MRTAVVDYGMSNLRSVTKRFLRLGINVMVSDNPLVIDSAQKIVLPGVGNFHMGMKNLRERDLVDVLNKKVIKDKISKIVETFFPSSKKRLNKEIVKITSPK